MFYTINIWLFPIVPTQFYTCIICKFAVSPPEQFNGWFFSYVFLPKKISCFKWIELVTVCYKHSSFMILFYQFCFEVNWIQCIAIQHKLIFSSYFDKLVNYSNRFAFFAAEPIKTDRLSLSKNMWLMALSAWVECGITISVIHYISIIQIIV